MIRVDYPEYDAYMEFPDKTPMAEIEKASFANFPPVDQIRDDKGQWRIDITALPKLPVAYAEDMAKAGKESGFISGARKSFAGTLEDLAGIAERPGPGLDEIIGRPMGEAIRGVADYMRPPETPEYTPQTFGQKLREAAGYATAELPKYMVAGRLTAKPVERLIPALEGIGEKIAEKVATKGVTGLAGRLAEKAPAILPEMAKQATTFGAVGAFDEGPSGAAHGAATAVPFTLGMLPAKRLYRALAGGTAGAGMAAATGGSDEDIAINGLLMGFLGGLTPQIKNKIKFEIESNPESKISELPTVKQLMLPAPDRIIGEGFEGGTGEITLPYPGQQRLPAPTDFYATTEGQGIPRPGMNLIAEPGRIISVHANKGQAVVAAARVAKATGIKPEIREGAKKGQFYLLKPEMAKAPAPEPTITEKLEAADGPLTEQLVEAELAKVKGVAEPAPKVVTELGSEAYIQARKSPDGTYQLFHVGTRNEIFPGEKFRSANEARQYWKAMKAKEQAVKQPVPAEVKGIAEPAPAPKQPWEMTREGIETTYPKASKIVDGRKVRDEIPNMESIGSSIDNSTILPGIYEIPLAEFGLTGRHYSVAGTKRIDELASEISINKEINPLIVVIEANGPYILEGATRAESLYKLGAKAFPAKVVIDEGSFYDATKQALAEGKPVPAEVLKDYPELAPKAEVPAPAAKQPRRFEMTAEEYNARNEAGWRRKKYEAIKKEYGEDFNFDVGGEQSSWWKAPQYKYVDAEAYHGVYGKRYPVHVAEADHRSIVEQALAEGKSVPEEVLKDYPDLAPKAEMPEPIPLSPGSAVKSKYEVDPGDDFISTLQGKIDAAKTRRDWSKAPAITINDAVEGLKKEIRPYINGRSNGEIRARTALAKATTFDEVADAISKLKPVVKEPTPLSPGSTVKVGKSPQTHTIVEELPATEAEMSLGERYFKVKNDKTGKVDTVEAGSLKSVKKSGGTKLYSGLPYDEFVAQAKKIFEGVRHLDKEFSPELKAMLNKAWRTSVFIVEKFPARKPVWDAHKQREDVRNEIKSKILSPDEMGYKGVDPFVSLPKEKSALLDRLLDEGDVRKRLFTDQELAKVDPEVAIAYKAAGEVIRREQSEIISGIERLAWIPYENKPWVNDLRRVMQEGGSIPENAPADFRRAAERILDTYDRIEMFKGQIKANPAYVPRVRENGSFVTRVHEVMPDGSTVERYAKIFKSEGQARRHEAEVKANPAKFMPRNYRQGAEYTFESADMAKLPEGLYNLHGTEPATLSIIKKGIDRLASKKEMSEAETDDMIQSISDAYLEQMAARGAGRHFLGRSENLIEGYDNTNYARIITRQAESMAGWLSKAEFAMRATKAISKMQPRDAEWSVSFVNDMLRNATAADQAVGMARGILTAKYMGYELGQMLVNSLQHYMTAIPEMSRHTKSAGMQMEKARLDVISGKLTDFDQKVIHDAVRRGEVLSRQVTELTGAAERGVGEISQNIGKVIDHSMRGFSAVEQHLNREPAFLAAMRLFTGAKKENGQYYGLNKNGKPYNHDYETAMRLARDFVDKTHYDVSAANMPEFFRKLGPAGKLVYTFSSFPVNYINWFVRRAAHKEFGVVGRALLATWAFGGFKALPGVGEDLDRMMQHNFGISPVLALRRGVRRMTKEYGLGMDEAIERVIIGGLPELADVNLTGRVSIKAPFGIMDPGKSPSEKIGGVWSALAQESLQAFDAAKNDDWYRAAESLAPRALKQPMQAERMYSEGMTTPRGETVFDESGQPMKLTGGEAARKAIGLQPSRMAGLQEKRGYEVNLKRVWEEKKSSIATRIRKHPERAGEEINKYNKALMDSDARTLVAPIGSETIERWLIPVPNQRRMMFQQDIDR